MSITDFILTQVRQKELKLSELKLNLPYLAASIAELEYEHGISMLQENLKFNADIFIEPIIGSTGKKIQAVKVPSFSVSENGYSIEYKFINYPHCLSSHKSLALLPEKGYKLSDYTVIDIVYSRDKKPNEEIIFLFDKPMTELSIYYVGDMEKPVLDPVFFQTLSFDLAEMLSNSTKKVVTQFETLLENFYNSTLQ